MVVGRYLVLLPEGLLGADLGDVVRGLADEAPLPGPHPGDPERVLRPPRASPTRLTRLLEHALLVVLLLLGAVGGRGRVGGEEARVRLAEALPRFPLPLVRHRLGLRTLSRRRAWCCPRAWYLTLSLSLSLGGGARRRGTGVGRGAREQPSKEGFVLGGADALRFGLTP